MVVDTKSDFAIAHDGDADRAIIVADDGKLLGLDTQLAIAVMHILDKNPHAKIVSTVESSLSLREIVESYKAELQITPVGSAKVASLMRENGAVFGGEPCGEYVFANALPTPDGIMSGAFFAQIFSDGQKLSSLAKKVKTYPIMRDKIACKNELKQTAMSKIKAKWPFCTPNTIDGLRSDEKWGWVLVRPSGTEPYIRITIEAKDDNELKKQFNVIKTIVSQACK
jgi:phosphoglucosamine mutase